MGEGISFLFQDVYPLPSRSFFSISLFRRLMDFVTGICLGQTRVHSKWLTQPRRPGRVIHLPQSLQVDLHPGNQKYNGRPKPERPAPHTGVYPHHRAGSRAAGAEDAADDLIHSFSGPRELCLLSFSGGSCPADQVGTEHADSLQELLHIDDQVLEHLEKRERFQHHFRTSGNP